MADESSIKTYSLDEVAAMVLPSEMKNGPRWLAERLNRGDLSGYTCGHQPRASHPIFGPRNRRNVIEK